MTRKFKRSPLALAILVLLHEAPMHPYRMQRLIKDRGKDQVINVGQRASLYQTIGQLVRAELITTWETEQPEGFPERTVYKVTEKGHHTAVTWMREMLSESAPEYPDFPAAVSLLPLLTPADALQHLQMREGKLVARITAIDAEMQSVNLPRLFLLEAEYTRTTLEAELTWLRSVVADLRSGELTWHQDWMNPQARPDNES